MKKDTMLLLGLGALFLLPRLVGGGTPSAPAPTTSIPAIKGTSSKDIVSKSKGSTISQSPATPNIVSTQKTANAMMASAIPAVVSAGQKLSTANYKVAVKDLASQKISIPSTLGTIAVNALSAAQKKTVAR